MIAALPEYDGDDPRNTAIPEQVDEYVLSDGTILDGEGRGWLVFQRPVDRVKESREITGMCRSGYVRLARDLVRGFTPAEAPGPVTETADGGTFTIIRGGRAYTVTVAPATTEG